MENCADRKREIREAWKKNYPRDPKARAQASRDVCRWILASPQFRAANVIAIFAGRPSEIDLSSLWHERPEACVFPVADPVTSSLTFYRVETLGELTPGYARIPEPRADELRRISKWTPKDLILLPGFGFDDKGARVGSGLGFYDRFLSTVIAQKWAVCFAEQVSATAIPQDPTDIRMDCLVTPAGILRIG